MPSPVIPGQFCEAVPNANADLCTRFTKFLGVIQLLCDFFSWFLGSDGAISDEAINEISTSILPPGSIQFSVASSMGSGWLLADGSDVSRTTYANLFAAIGTRYGNGDGSTTFGIPDLRGRSLMGAGLGDGLTNRDINVINVGEENHTQIEAELASHRHAYNTSDGQQILVQQQPGKVNDIDRTGSLDYAFADPMELAGASQPFNVIHPCVIAFAFIKT